MVVKISQSLYDCFATVTAQPLLAGVIVIVFVTARRV